MNFIFKYKKLLVLALLLIAFFPYIYISFYSNPIADDFTFAFKGKIDDFFRVWIDVYIHWSGRYTANFFVLLNPIAFNSFFGYKLVPILIIALLVLSFYFFIKAVTCSLLKPDRVVALALVSTLLFVYQMPIISEGIYWYTGAVTYQLGIVFSLLYVGMLTQLLQKKYLLKSKFIHIPLLTLTLFFTIGSNEILMIALLSFSMILFFILWKHKMENRQVAFYLLIASAIFSATVYLAPGNAFREAYFPNNHQFIYSIALSVAQTFRFFLTWISSAPLLLLSVLYYFLNKELSRNIHLFSKSFYLTPVTTLLLLFFVIFIGSFPAYWSTGILGQHRTMNISYFLFIIMWFVSLTVFFNNKQFKINEISRRWELIIFILVWNSLVFTKNGYHAINDIRSGMAQKFNEQMTKRYSIIHNTQGPVYFKPIENPPKTLFVLDITEDPNHWINRAYNVFFEAEDKPILREKASND